MTEDEKFFAWLDGELAPAEAAAMDAKVAADPKLRRAAEEQRALRSRLKAAFDPVAAAPVPERLQAALRPSAEIIDFTAAKRARSRPSTLQWASLAATLLLGILFGTMLPQRGGSPVAVQGGKLYAAASLDHALETQLASAPRGNTRIGLTFRDHSGDICRSFTAQAASGLACRSDGRWQLKALFSVPESQAGDYRMASGMDPNLAALVDSSMTGEPFDATQEKAAMKRRWR